MSKLWREPADPKKHSDFMSSYNDGGVPIPKSRDNLIDKWVYFVSVCNFTFQFANIEQLKEAKNYFEQKIHKSNLDISHPPHEHYLHPWYCKLPKGITKDSKRTKVLKALNKALEQWK